MKGRKVKKEGKEEEKTRVGEEKKERRGEKKVGEREGRGKRRRKG